MPGSVTLAPAAMQALLFIVQSTAGHGTSKASRNTTRNDGSHTDTERRTS